jgi:hypothetical protein
VLPLITLLVRIQYFAANSADFNDFDDFVDAAVGLGTVQRGPEVLLCSYRISNRATH